MNEPIFSMLTGKFSSGFTMSNGPTSSGFPCVSSGIWDMYPGDPIAWTKYGTDATTGRFQYTDVTNGSWTCVFIDSNGNGNSPGLPAGCGFNIGSCVDGDIRNVWVLFHPFGSFAAAANNGQNHPPSTGWVDCSGNSLNIVLS